MAVITQLPPMEVIQSHKGVLDYYYWRGLYVVRQWPRKSAHPITPNMAVTLPVLAAYSKALATLTPALYQAALAQTKGTLWTWKDVTTAAAFGTLYY